MKDKTLNDDAKALGDALRVIAVDGAKAQEYSLVAQAARRDIADAMRLGNAPIDEPSLDRKQTPASRLAFANSVKAHNAKVSALTAVTENAEKALDKLTPVLAAARSKSVEILRAIESAREARCEAAIRAAVDAAPSHAVYQRELDLLTSITAKVVGAERELERIQAAPPTLDELAESRVSSLLDTGTFADSSHAKDPKEAIVKLLGHVREGRHAIHRQEKIVGNAQRVFAAEVTANLKPTMNGLVVQIAEGYSAARAATLEAGILRRAYNRAGCDSDNLPVFISGFVQPPAADYDGWSMELEKWRRAGYTV
jgi:hypothetical protein